MTAEQLQQLIAAGLSCEHIEVTGDGRHWAAVIVSPEFEGKRPVVHPEAFVAETATLIGDVTVERNASVWYGAVVRADICTIVIREGSNIQDNSVLHAAPGETLVVGPNAIFARYVENVLPGLGETGVRLATPGDLVEGVVVGAIDSAADGRVKGAAAMVDTMRATLYGHVGALDVPAAIGFDRWQLEVTPEDSQRVIDEAVSADKPYAEGRVLAHLAEHDIRQNVAAAAAGALDHRRRGFIAGRLDAEDDQCRLLHFTSHMGRGRRAQRVG